MWRGIRGTSICNNFLLYFPSQSSTFLSKHFQVIIDSWTLLCLHRAMKMFFLFSKPINIFWTFTPSINSAFSCRHIHSSCNQNWYQNSMLNLRQILCQILTMALHYHEATLLWCNFLSELSSLSWHACRRRVYVEIEHFIWSSRCYSL